MTVRAYEKARSLKRFAENNGLALGGFSLILTKDEVFEVLEDFVTMQRDPEEAEDMASTLMAARLQGDPWPLAGDLKVLGFRVAPAEQVLQ